MKALPVIFFLVTITTVTTYAQLPPVDAKTNFADSSGSNVIFERVEIEASYPGGEAGWRKFLEKNLKASTPVDNSAPIGYYKVWVQFVVSKDGSLSEIKALTKVGYGMEAEVLRIIRSSGKWMPASQGGRHVKAYRKQPVIFVVAEEDVNITPSDPYVLYTHTDNKVEINIGKFRSNELQVTVPGGTVSRNNDGSFLVRVSKPGRVTMQIKTSQRKNNVHLVSYEVLSPEETPGMPPTSY